MATAIDSTSPAKFTGTPNNNVDITSAAFTPPNTSLLVATVCADTNANENATFSVSDSLGGTWTLQIEADEGTEAGGAGGHSSIWTRPIVTGASMTVSARRTAGVGGTKRIQCKVYVVTGYDSAGTPVDATGVANRGASTTNNLSTDSVTPGAAGHLIACGTDWNQLGAPTSSDLQGEDANPTLDTGDFAGAISCAHGFKTVSSGVATTANLNAGGTAAAAWQWTQIVVREAPATGTTVTPTTAALTTTRFAPVLKLAVTPTTKALTLAAFAPVLRLTVTPTTKALTLAAFAPTVTSSNEVVVTPSTASLVLTMFAPTVTTTTDVPAPISTTSFRPDVLVGQFEIERRRKRKVADLFLLLLG